MWLTSALTMLPSDVERLKQAFFGHRKSMPISGVEPWVSSLVLPYTHRTIVKDLNRVNCFEKIRACARVAREMQFCTLGRVPTHAH